MRRHIVPKIIPIKNPQAQNQGVTQKFLDLLLIFSIFTLSWNGLQDAFTNSTYLFLAIYAFLLRIKTNRTIRIKHLSPLLVSLFASTLVAMFLGQGKQEFLNILENQNFSSSRMISTQVTTYSPIIDLIPAFKWYLALISLPFIVQILKITNLELLRRTVHAWIYGLLFNVLTQLLQFFQLPNFSFLANPQVSLLNSRFPGLASHPNALAISICMTIPLIFFPFARINRIQKISFTFVMILSIYITESRAGLVVLAFTLFCLYVLEKDFGRIQIGKFFTVSTLVVLSFGLGFLGKAISVTRLSSKDTSAKVSNAERVQLLQYGWKAFLEYPITGAGPVNLKISHNIYLQVLSSIGILGFICFVLFMIRLLSDKTTHSFYEKLPLIVFLIFGLFNNSLSDFYLYFPIGFAYSLTQQRRDYRTKNLLE